MPDIAPDKPKPKRRWLQFRLRSLFILVAVVAVPCGLFKWKWDRKQAERRAVAEIKQAGGSVIYDREVDGKDTAPGPACLRAILGDDWFAEVKHVKTNLYPAFDIDHFHALKGLQTLWIWGHDSEHFTDADFAFLTEMNDLEELMLNGVHFTDAGVSTIKSMRRLTKLHLDRTEITDSGLEGSSHVAALEELSLARSHTTDSGLVHLRALPALRELNLRETSITDDGLEDLKKMKWLIHFCVDDTQLSPAGKAELRNALPNCTVGLAPPDVLAPEKHDVGIEERYGDPRREGPDRLQADERLANP
jgi:hypothetical protein